MLSGRLYCLHNALMRIKCAHYAHYVAWVLECVLDGDVNQAVVIGQLPVIGEQSEDSVESIWLKCSHVDQLNFLRKCILYPVFCRLLV